MRMGDATSIPSSPGDPDVRFRTSGAAWSTATRPQPTGRANRSRARFPFILESTRCDRFPIRHGPSAVGQQAGGADGTGRVRPGAHPTMHRPMLRERDAATLSRAPRVSPQSGSRRSTASADASPRPAGVGVEVLSLNGWSATSVADEASRSARILLAPGFTHSRIVSGGSLSVARPPPDSPPLRRTRR